MPAKIRFLPGKAGRKPEKRKCLDGKVEENRSHARVVCVLFFCCPVVIKIPEASGAQAVHPSDEFVGIDTTYGQLHGTVVQRKLASAVGGHLVQRDDV